MSSIDFQRANKPKMTVDLKMEDYSKDAVVLKKKAKAFEFLKKNGTPLIPSVAVKAK